MKDDDSFEIWPGREVVAVHEAAHAVAIALTGGRVISANVRPIDESGERWWGYVEAEGDDVPEIEVHFCTFAGPWAEARCGAPLFSLTQALIRGAAPRSEEEVTGGMASDWDLLTTARDGSRLPDWWWEGDGTSEAWSKRLDSLWPAILAVACLMLADVPINTELVHQALSLDTNRVDTNE